MSLATLIPLVVSVMTAATPLLFAGLGELVAERAGVLNLGVEGMMLVGAIAGFATVATTGNPALGILAAAAAGALLAGVFGVLVLTLASNQVATGLALTLFGTGLSALAGAAFVGHPIAPLAKVAIPGLSSLPVLGLIVFGQDPLVYLSIAATAGVAWFLGRSRAGLILRGVGEAQGSAHAIGHDVLRIRYGAVVFGGAMAGLGGAYLSLAYTPMWAEGMTAGRGWIALALVVFGAWRPWRVLLGAYLFGGIAVVQLYLQGSGLVVVPTQVMAMLPYVATIAVLTFISAGPMRKRLSAPACLGKPFRPAA